MRRQSIGKGLWLAKPVRYVNALQGLLVVGLQGQRRKTLAARHGQQAAAGGKVRFGHCAV